MYAPKNTASDTYITYSNYITKLIFTLNKLNNVTYLKSEYLDR